MLLRLALLVPLLVVLVVFTLTNRQTVLLSFWPTPASLEAPVSLVLLAALGGGMLLGAAMLSGGTLRLRWRARRAEQARAMLEAELRRVRANPPAPPLPPPG